MYWDGVGVAVASDTLNRTVGRHGLLFNQYWDPYPQYTNFYVHGTYRVVTRVEISAPSATLTYTAAQTLTANAFDANNQPVYGLDYTWSSSDPIALSVTGAGGNTATVQATGLGAATITATPSRGPAATVNLTASVSDILVYDFFTGTNGTLLTAHDPNISRTNAPWSMFGDQPIVLQNDGIKAGAIGASAGSAMRPTLFAISPSGQADVTINTTWRPHYSDGRAHGAIIVRYTDPGNYIAVVFVNNSIGIYKAQNGGFELVPGNYSYAPVSWVAGSLQAIQVRTSGDQIHVDWNGQVGLVASDPLNRTSGRHGLGFNANWDAHSSFDTISIKGAFPTVTRVELTTLNTNPVIDTSQLVTAQAFGASNQPVYGLDFAWTTSNPAIMQPTPNGAASAVVWAREIGPATLTLTPSRGPVQTAGINVQAGNHLIFDRFFGSNGTPIGNEALSVNQSRASWSTAGAAAVVVHDGGIRPASAGSAPGWTFAIADVGVSDVHITTKWHASATNPYGGIVVRYQDPYNYLAVLFSSSHIGLYRVSGGYASLLPGNYTTAPIANVPGQTHIIEVAVEGSRISAAFDGAVGVVAFDSTNPFGGRHGVYWNTAIDATSTFDDFRIVGAVPKPVSTLSIDVETESMVPFDSQVLTIFAADGSTPVTASPVVRWISSDNSVVRISLTSFTTALLEAVGVGTATITVQPLRGTAAGIELSISVVRCASAPSPASITVPGAGTSGSTEIAAAPTCNWTARSTTDWLATVSPVSSFGDGTVTFSANPNYSGSRRFGTLSLFNGSLR